MAATDQTYRKQKTLDIVFAVSCILMLLSTLWMFWQDYNREFKHVQREFRDVEEAMNEHQMIAGLPTGPEVDAKRKIVADAKKKLDDKRKEVQPLRARSDGQARFAGQHLSRHQGRFRLENELLEHRRRAPQQGRDPTARPSRKRKSMSCARKSPTCRSGSPMPRTNWTSSTGKSTPRSDQAFGRPAAGGRAGGGQPQASDGRLRSLCQGDGPEALEVRRYLPHAAHPRRLRVADQDQANLAARFDHRLRRFQGRAALRSLHLLPPRHRARQLRSRLRLRA